MKVSLKHVLPRIADSETQAAALSQEVEGARERERRMREEMVALRGKVMMLESNAGLVSSEAEKKERALRNELQV